jgi:hypothetical protein
MLTAALLFAVGVFAQNAAPLPNALAAYAGRWSSSAQFLDTPMTKAGSVASRLECNWSRDSKYLVCNQIVQLPTGEQHQLTVYGYNDQKHEYTYATFGAPGASPTNGQLEVSDRRFVYLGDTSAQRQFRSINEFSSSGDEYAFFTEFSTDGGQHWTKMLEGTSKRVKD